MSDIGIEHLYDSYVKDSLVDEATAFATIPTGRYQVQFDQRVVQEGNDADNADLYERQYVRLGTVVNNGDRRLGRFSIFASWIERRTQRGGLDRLSRAYGQLVKAYNASGKSVGEVLDMAMQYPVELSINEICQEGGEGGQWKTITTDDQRKKAKESGWRITNSLGGIRAVKA